MELGPLQEEWLQALESGKYEQGIGRLHTTSTVQGQDAFCCLGVACDLIKEKFPELVSINRFSDGLVSYNEETSVLPVKVMVQMNFINQNPDIEWEHSLASMNDSGKSFCTIAHAIRKKPELIFEGPA